jgi:hypothetical protein
MCKKLAIQQYLDKCKRTNEIQTQEEPEQSNETLLSTICGKAHLGVAAKCWQNEFQTHEEHEILQVRRIWTQVSKRQHAKQQ